jgi:hypothetical protein
MHAGFVAFPRGEHAIMNGCVFIRSSICLLVALVTTATTVKGEEIFALPQGIGPTSATLAVVLTAAQRADGYANPPSSRLVEGTVMAWGLHGTFRTIEAGDNFKLTTNLGLVSWQTGRLNGQLWEQNENGLVTSFHDETEMANIDLVPPVMNPEKPDLKMLGETRDSSPLMLSNIVRTKLACAGFILIKRPILSRKLRSPAEMSLTPTPLATFTRSVRILILGSCTSAMAYPKMI